MIADYNLTDVFRFLLYIIGLCVLMMITGGAGFIVLVPIVLTALFMKKTEQLVMGLLVANATLLINGFFAPKGFTYGVSHRGLLCIVGLYGSLLLMSVKKTRYVTILLGLIFYFIYMLIPSFFGWDPTISILKMLLFLSVYMALAYSCNNAIIGSNIGVDKIRAMILALAVFFIVGSVLISPFPSIAHMTALEILESGGDYTSLYKGMTSHSQTLGMVMAFFIIFLFTDMIFHLQKFDKLYIILIILGLGLLYYSSGRTAMGTMVASCGFSYMFSLRYHVRMRSGWKVKLGVAVAAFVILGGFAAMAIPQIRDGIVRYAMKYNQGAQSGDFDMEYAVSTRQGLVDEQIYNFKRKPTIGWGFQVSEQVAEMAKETRGLILSAPVEKGVWVTAILEEGGVFGEIIYVTYFLIALMLLFARKAYMGLTIFLAIHISNLGEMTMFSMSGCGGLWYTFLFIALIFDAKRIQSESTARYAYNSWGGYLR